MKSALIALALAACPSLGLAQSGAADRVATVEVAPPQDTWIVKVLRPFAPDGDKPLTGKEKFTAYLSDSIGPSSLFREAAAAGISQARDNPPEWGGRISGYGRRFADDLGYNVVHQTIAYSAAALFHEDNRYFASGKTSVKGRTVHALLSPFEAHHADGRVSFSYSGVAGVVGASAIERLWEPPSERGPENVGLSIAYSLAGAAAYDVFREFVPDIIRRIQKR
jgi:hypothetical protein